MIHAIRIYVVFGLVLCMGIACNTTLYTPDNLPERQLHFGSGGGFAGTSTEYLLLDNGQLFRNEGKGYTSLESARPGAARRVFKAFYKMNLDTLDYNQPGNLYYFIKMQDRGTTYEITWGGFQDAPSKALEVYYQSLNQIVNP
ncbi:MAG: hypothetical protein DHS20C18_05480 [Saprospiraceae bacterium]|nr:MAG: hypothetical protein DHS20C18_05480 [Saprospiraceae bacterium]